ncbi:Endonuclease/exonuclease/phosphatase [Pisolithus albus]|nr:Endonuclease/exonuclease/phosphatase [Pisolithus albus]
MRDDRIAILALQETHVSPAQADELNNLFSDTLHIIACIDPSHTSAKGVAIVLNKCLVKTLDVNTHEIIPGRAILISMPWYQQERLNVLNVYGPNDPSQNQNFWDEIHDKIMYLPQPDVLLGDFNIIKDSIDRLPAHTDNANGVNALRSLRTHLNLQDGWQGGRASRIDHIYVLEDMFPFCKEWEISPPAIHTDHQLVSVNISKCTMPFIGKGRWTLNPTLLKDTLTHELEECSHNVHSTSKNPQTIFKSFKENAIRILRNRARTLTPTISKKISDLQNELQATLNNKELNESDKIQMSGNIREDTETVH